MTLVSNMARQSARLPSAMVHSRGVDDDIKPSRLLGGLRDEGLQCVVVVQIECADGCPSAPVFDRPRHFLKSLDTASRDEDMASFVGKEASRCLADTGRSACNDSSFALKRGHAGLRDPEEMTNRPIWSSSQVALKRPLAAYPCWRYRGSVRSVWGRCFANSTTPAGLRKF